MDCSANPTPMPQLRELDATLVRIYVYWSQVEPDPGNFTFEVVDALLDQLGGSEEVWITVCSSSRWATQRATDFLPPSPAKDLNTYYEFVFRMVRHCAGRVHFWQCDNEPSNVGLTWLGSAQDYVAQLQVMHRAVKEATRRPRSCSVVRRICCRPAPRTAQSGSFMACCCAMGATLSTFSTCTFTVPPSRSSPTSRPCVR